MSSTDDASSRLSNALESILAGRSDTAAADDDSEATRRQPAAAGPADPPAIDADQPTADWSVDDDPADVADSDDSDGSGDEYYELPPIVPATHPVPLPDANPSLAPPAPAAPPAPPAAAVPNPPAARVAPTPARPATPPGADAEPAASASSSAATGWGDHMAPLPANAGGAPLRAPGRRPRVRRVTRVLRHIDPWSTFKVALLFSAVAYVVFLTAGVLLWRVADETGTLDNVERWFTQFGWETFELKGGEIFHNAWIIGLFGMVALTGALVLLATLFNLVSDIVGGVRMTVLEEEVVERTISSTRRYVVRRGPAGTDSGASPAQDWDVDGDEPIEASAGASADWSVDDDDVGPPADRSG